VDDGAKPSGVLLVRAWVQDGEVVARLRWSTSTDSEQRVEVVAGVQRIEDAVRRWLSDLAGVMPS
jgi:capsid protein